MTIAEHFIKHNERWLHFYLVAHSADNMNKLEALGINRAYYVRILDRVKHKPLGAKISISPGHNNIWLAVHPRQGKTNTRFYEIKGFKNATPTTASHSS